jgi:hypothetical protein
MLSVGRSRGWHPEAAGFEWSNVTAVNAWALITLHIVPIVAQDSPGPHDRYIAGPITMLGIR